MDCLHIAQHQVGWPCRKEGGPCVLSDSLCFRGICTFDLGMAWDENRAIYGANLMD